MKRGDRPAPRFLTLCTILVWSFFACSVPAGAVPPADARIAELGRELDTLRASLDIPGLAYGVVQDGKVIATGSFGVTQDDPKRPFTTRTSLRIASVTKAVTAVLIMQLVEEGKLDLAAPANRYLKGGSLPPEVQVQHLMSHSSEGVVGDEFVYGTMRYAKLGAVVEAASGQPFAEAMRRRIVERAGMHWYPSDQLAAHGGLVSTVDDMLLFLAALDRGTLIGDRSMERLATPSEFRPGRRLPLSLAWFVEDVQGEKIMWSYGQDDPDYGGALLLRVPRLKLSLFILADSDVISDPFRLLMGDVRKSPFAMSFLRLFLFSPPGQILPPLPAEGVALPAWLDREEARSPYVYRDELAGSALIDVWHQQTASAQSKLLLLLDRYRLREEPDPVLHFAFMSMGWSGPDQLGIAWGRRLLADHPNNRWILLSQAYLLQKAGQEAEATDLFNRILALPNQEPDFLHKLFNNWSWMALAQMHRDDDPEAARYYLQQIIDSGTGGPATDDARRMLGELGS